MDEKISYKALIEQGMEAEKNGDTKGAVELYRQANKQSPTSELPYQRLMVIYRKAKDYKKELAVINQAIQYFEKLYNQKHTQQVNFTTKSARLSKALAKSLGLTDKKGKDLHKPEPIFKWQKRKDLLLKKTQL